MSTAPDSSEKKTILFENGQSAEVLHIRQATDANEILKALSVPEAEAAIIVGGSSATFPDHIKNRLLDLVSRGVAQAALESKAILIDEGTKGGVSELVGQGAVDRGRKQHLVGVLPRGTTSPDDPESGNSLEVNHTRFFLNEGEQLPRQAEMMCRLADAVGSKKGWILTVLVGGEPQGMALNLALETIRRGWTLVVIEGSGGLADQMVDIKKRIRSRQRRTGRWWKLIYRLSRSNPVEHLRDSNPRLYEVISDGRIMVVSKDFDATQLRNLIKGIFVSARKTILWTAWQRFAEYDQNSSRHRDEWRKLRNRPLYLGVLSTLLVLLHSTATLDPARLIEGEQNLPWASIYTGVITMLGNFIRNYSGLDLALRLAIIALPIIITYFLSLETRLKLGSKYLVLRGAAEAVKRGIYSFRVLKGRTKDSPESLLPYDEQDLAKHLGRVSKLLSDSDVNESAFVPYGGLLPPNMFGTEAYDDGFSPLSPETYVRVRIGDQLKFYTTRTNQFEKQIRSLQSWMLIFGGIGAFLAAVGAQYWLPLTAAIVSAATAYLEYQQWEQLLAKYNLTKASLEIVQADWLALPEDEREDDKRVQSLVREVEAILESENQGWVQYIKQAQEPGKDGAKTT